MGMIQSRSGLCFAPESRQSLRITCDLVGEEFEGDKAVQADVFGFVHDSHPAAAEFLENAVMRNGLADERLGLRHLASMLALRRKVSQRSYDTNVWHSTQASRLPMGSSSFK